MKNGYDVEAGDTHDCAPRLSFTKAPGDDLSDYFNSMPAHLSRQHCCGNVEDGHKAPPGPVQTAPATSSTLRDVLKGVLLPHKDCLISAPKKVDDKNNIAVRQ